MHGTANSVSQTQLSGHVMHLLRHRGLAVQTNVQFRLDFNTRDQNTKYWISEKFKLISFFVQITHDLAQSPWVDKTEHIEAFRGERIVVLVLEIASFVERIAKWFGQRGLRYFDSVYRVNFHPSKNYKLYFPFFSNSRSFKSHSLLIFQRVVTFLFSVLRLIQSLMNLKVYNTLNSVLNPSLRGTETLDNSRLLRPSQLRPPDWNSAPD